MPKPILSDSLFNADDVATAIVNEANLQIANSSLQVTDVTDKFTRQTDINPSEDKDVCFKFMGFVFVNLSCMKTSMPSHGTGLWLMDSSIIPSQDYHMTSITHQADFAHMIVIGSTGHIVISQPGQFSGTDDTFRIVINGWYRI